MEGMLRTRFWDRIRIDRIIWDWIKVASKGLLMELKRVLSHKLLGDPIVLF